MDIFLNAALDRIGPKYVVRIRPDFLTVGVRGSVSYYCSVPRTDRLAFDLYDLASQHHACVLAALYAADAIRSAEAA